MLRSGQSGHRIGLKNARSRLAFCKGPESDFRIDSSTESGAVVTLLRKKGAREGCKALLASRTIEENRCVVY